MNRQRRIFSSQLDKKLVEAIRKRPEIYDMSHSRYSDTVHKTHTWNQIAESLKLEPQLCKQRWESLRSQYRKIRRIRKLKTDQQSPTSTTKWKYEALLEFLNPHMRDNEPLMLYVQEHTQNSASGDDDEDQSEIEVKVERLVDSPSPVDIEQLNSEILTIKTLDSENNSESEKGTKLNSTNRKLTLVDSSTDFMDFILEDEKKSKKPGMDELDLFFESMKETVRKFSAADKHIAKQKIFMIVSDIESKYVYPHQRGQPDHLLRYGESSVTKPNQPYSFD